MTRRFWIGLVILAPGLVGCSPDGPSEFYRSALQARSEHVDALSRVVDDATAKANLETAGKLVKERLREIKELLDNEKTRLEPSWARLRRDNFDPKKLDEEDRGRMIVGLKAYHNYCKNLVYTNVRLGRELRRLDMLCNLYVLERAKSQIAANQPVTTSRDDCPNLVKLIASVDEVVKSKLEVFPGTFTVDQLARLDAGMDKEQLLLMIQFDPKNFGGQGVQLEPPPLPRYPEWAIDVDRRAKLGLTGR